MSFNIIFTSGKSIPDARVSFVFADCTFVTIISLPLFVQVTADDIFQHMFFAVLEKT
jgi:hypothetical protein